MMHGDDMQRLPQQELTALNVELGELTPVVNAFTALQAQQQEAEELDSIIAGGDSDVLAMARHEKKALLQNVPFLIVICSEKLHSYAWLSKL